LLWDLTSGVALVEMTGEEEAGEWLEFSDQGDQLALLLSDGRISLWDTLEAAEKFTLEDEATRTFLFAPDGTLLLYVMSDGGLLFLDTAMGEQMLELTLTGASGEVSPYFVYDGKVLAVETGDELQLWGIYSGEGQPSALNMRPLTKPYGLRPVGY
jgi:WD40 repeat protein